MKKLKLDAADLAIIRDGAKGVCMRGAWTWIHEGEIVTRNVKRFIKLGLMADTYYAHGNAGAWKTELGDEILKSHIRVT